MVDNINTHDNAVLSDENESSGDDSDDDLLNSILFDDSDEDTEAQQHCNQLLIYACPLEQTTIIRRPSFHVRDRMVWADHMCELVHESPFAFQRMYQMLHHLFTKLCKLLKPALEVNAIMSSRRTNKEVINAEIVLASYLRWVGGRSYLDIRTAAGISVASFYRVIKKCTAALLSCQQLQYSSQLHMKN
jgi:hypothetical protein